jgi:colanic acid/amylovoran biosynthesis glycosyltransferase
MKIAVLTQVFPAISETFILDQITGFLDRGHEVEIIALEKGSLERMHSNITSYRLVDRTTYLTIPRSRQRKLVEGSKIFARLVRRRPAWLPQIITHLLRFDPAKASRLVFDLGPLLGRPKYDVIHCHFGPIGELGRRLRRIGALEGRLITTFHGYDVGHFLKEQGENAYNDLFREGDLFTYSSNFVGERLMHAGCPPDKSIRFRLGVDLRQFSFSERYVWPGEPIRVITVARLAEKKGLEYSIQAVAEVIKAHPVLRYDIVGGGPLRQHLSHLIHKLKVEDNVKMLGPKSRDELRALYARAHIFLLTSVTSSTGDQEGQGLVLQEAQAVGLPVICTNHNGFPEGILPGQSGFLVPERDVGATAHQLTELIKDPSRWAEIGRNGRRFVECEFDLDKRNSALLEVYKGLIASKPSKSIMVR